MMTNGKTYGRYHGGCRFIVFDTTTILLTGLAVTAFLQPR